MPRPIICRKVGFVPDVIYFKPVGIPMRDLEEVELSLDELESIRLADFEGKAVHQPEDLQEQIANLPANPSRPGSLGRIPELGLRV